MKKSKLSMLLAFSLSVFVVLTGCKGGEKAAEQAAKPAEAPKTAKLSEADFERAKRIYFDRCSGCHGALRKGATGPNITPEKMEKKKDKLKKIIFEGTEGGMPGWGKDGFMTQEETDLMAAYIMEPAPAPPEWGMKEIEASWKVHIPVKDRPTAPPKANWQNYFGVIQRDAGKVSIVDGDKKEVLATLPSGFAVHILRTSASGRYMYSVGRDGRVTMIDLWSEPPTLVAEIKTGIDARSMDTSKYKGFVDKYAVVGNYWPPSYVILNGADLQPLKVAGTPTYHIDKDSETFVLENRVASIVASHDNPEWVLNLKESGIVMLVDYSKVDVGTVTETKINAERFLHDGGWDSTKRYFLVAANARDTISVIDTKERKLVKNIITGTKPHPGRGANWTDPQYGRVWATVHLGEGLVSIISTDPAKEHAWTVVREWKLAGNSLFIKTHPKSEHVYCDNTINKDKSNVITVFNKNKPDDPPKELTFDKKVVHLEYNKAGDEMWIGVWDKDGALIVIDDKTLEVKATIPGLVAPTGKFNVYNTMHDIY